MNKKRGQKAFSSNENDFSWNYFDGGHRVPELARGTVVLVEYFGRDRVAVVSTKVPGGIYWAELSAPASGSTRVLVTLRSLKAVAANA